jgi:hypothetical protein
MATNTMECGRYLHNKIPETSVAALGRPAGRAPFSVSAVLFWPYFSNWTTKGNPSSISDQMDAKS